MSRQKPKRGFRRVRHHNCPSRKRAFATREAAQKMVAKVNADNERKGDERRLVRVYMCPLCMFFHVTQMEKGTDG